MDKQRKKIWITVAGVHCIMLALLSSGYIHPVVAKRKSPIVVRTCHPPTLLNKVTEQQPSTTQTLIQQSEPRNMVRTINKNLQNTKKPQKKAPPCKKPSPPPKKPTEKRPPPKSAKQSQKWVPKSTPDNVTSTSITPKAGPTTDVIDPHAAYFTAVLELLQAQLTLPEKGKVRLQITVQPNGKIAKIEVLESENAQNAAYLTSALETLVLPPCALGEELTFCVEFRSE